MTEIFTNKIKTTFKQYSKISVIFEKISVFLGIKTKRPAHGYYGEKAQNYLTTRPKREKWLKEQTIMQELLSEVPDGSSVLDVPFGTGRFVDFYLKKNMKVFGIDISEDMINVSKISLGDAFNRCYITVGNAESLPYENDTFDLIVSSRFFTFLSMNMTKKVLSELYRVTKSKIILNIRIKKGDISAPLWIRNKKISGNICEKDLLKLFKDYNLKVVEKKLVNENSNKQYLFFVLQK